MQVQTPSPVRERRQRRSSHIQHALHYLSDAVATRVGLDNIVIANSAGFYMGAAVEGEEAIALATYAPVLAMGTATAKRDMLAERLREWAPAAHPDRVSFRHHELYGESFYLIALGDRVQDRESALDDVLPAVTRIFSESWLFD